MAAGKKAQAKLLGRGQSLQRVLFGQLLGQHQPAQHGQQLGVDQPRSLVLGSGQSSPCRSQGSLEVKQN
jgi:hypothetical protein